MSSSNLPNITPTTATTKHQSPVGQHNTNHLFPDLFCFKKSVPELVTCVKASLRGIGWKCNWRLHSHPIPRKDASEKPPHGQVGAESSGLSLDGAQGWGQIEAHPKLLIPKNSWRSSYPYPQVNPKQNTQGRERKGETKQKHSKSQPNIRVSLLHLLALPTAKTQS